MVLWDIAFFAVSLFVLMQGAHFATKYASRIAKSIHISEFFVSFFIIAIISAFPESAISIFSAIEGVPEIGLGTLLGSNVADLLLVFGIVALASRHGLKVSSSVLREEYIYVLLLCLPLILGVDGGFSRLDGIILVIFGIFFFIKLTIDAKVFRKELTQTEDKHLAKHVLFLLLSVAALLVGAHYALDFGIAVANDFGIPPLIISLTVLAIGTCLPELVISLKSVRHNHDGIAIGDIMGTVMTDATLVLGIVIIIQPFQFNPSTLLFMGGTMIFGGLLTMLFMDSEHELTKKEGAFLVLLYILFVAISWAMGT